MFQRYLFTTTTVLLIAAASPGGFSAPAPNAPDTLPEAVINDNRRSAGTLSGRTLTLNLRAAAAAWRPEGEQGPALAIEAFGETSGPLQVPAPLIRVAEGTEIVARVRNDLDHPLRVHGLCTRDGTPCRPIEVDPAAEREVRFDAGRAGTYHYWATSTGMPLAFRATGDTQLSGAFIVDAAGLPAPADRVLVIGDWTNLSRSQLMELAKADDPGAAFFAFDPRFTFVINGASWPSTERLTYRLGDDVRWRVVNLSSQAHPMHLHGFYFTVDSHGDGLRDTAYDADRKRLVVTQLLNPGETMTMTWRPEREGNWVFHCHVSEHISPERHLGRSHADSGHTAHGAAAPENHAASGNGHDHHAAHPATGMAGLVLGVTVLPGHQPIGDAAGPTRTPRALTLTMSMAAGQEGTRPAYGFSLTEGQQAAAASQISVPGPTLVLQRAEPVEIALVNRLAEPTAIHWHGMELESYYDGVHGWSGVGSRVTPLIEPGATFPVRFTPPRAGTFIYHTHLHDDRQLTGGLYGAMLVMERGETFDPDVDHVVVIGRDGPGRTAPVVLNGSPSPQFVWKAGARHRIRFINITPDDIFVVSLGSGDTAAEWTPVTKDGAPVPATEAPARAATQTIAVGETYDFEYQAPPGRRGLWLNVRTPGGKWAVQGRVVVK
jgi:manganese oxidase